MKRRSISLAGLLLASLLLACSAGPNASAPHKQTVGDAQSTHKLAPDFTLQDANGNSLKLSDLRGKVVLLNFWATWCGPCSLEIPWFEQFEQQYRAQGLEVVGVSMDEDGWKVIKPYITEHKINYRVLLGNDSVGQLYGGVDSLPTTFIIDRSGRVVFTHVGLAGKNEYLEEVQQLLNAPAQNTSHAALHISSGVLVASAAAEAYRR